jgi:mRNA deadenylase 3'-5' endonuclease subunit Ccr4
MSYNILSNENFKKRSDHLLTTDPCHDPDYRYRRVLAEIEQSNPEIICLQEVSTSLYQKMKDELESLGYSVAIDKSL